MLAAVAALTVPAGAAAAFATTVGFVLAPGRIVRGDLAHLAVRVGHASACTLGVRYHGGTVQRGLGRVQVIGGFAQWMWEIPTTVQAGAATASVRCAGTSVSRRFVVVGLVPAP